MTQSLGLEDTVTSTAEALLQSEVSLWSDMANKLNAIQSVPEALETCSQWVSQQMQMAAEWRTPAGR